MSEHHNNVRTPDYMQERVTLRYRETEQIIGVGAAEPHSKGAENPLSELAVLPLMPAVSAPLLLSMFVADTDQHYGRQI